METDKIITDDEQKCIDIIKGCIKKYLNRNFDNLDNKEKVFKLLKKFRMDNLKEDEEYGYLLGGKFDGDDTELAKAIMFLYHYKTCPFLKLNRYTRTKGYSKGYSSIESENGIYRLDTMNSLNTLFIEEEKDRKWLAKPKFDNENKTLISKVKEFYCKFQTVGNYILLPNISNEKFTINTYRSGYLKGTWRDYFDRFLYELRKCLKNDTDNKTNIDEGLLKLVKENDFYFRNFADFKEFCEKNILSGYLKANTDEISFFYEKDKNYRPAYWDKDLNKQDYIAFIGEYIKKSLEIIDNRSNKILNTVWDEYKNDICKIK